MRRETLKTVQIVKLSRTFSKSRVIVAEHSGTVHLFLIFSFSGALKSKK